MINKIEIKQELFTQIKKKDKKTIYYDIAAEYDYWIFGQHGFAENNRQLSTPMVDNTSENIKPKNVKRPA